MNVLKSWQYIPQTKKIKKKKNFCDTIKNICKVQGRFLKGKAYVRYDQKRAYFNTFRPI